MEVFLWESKKQVVHKSYFWVFDAENLYAL